MTRLLGPVPALEAALAALRRRPDALVVVDGRSGSGKTTFATALAAGSDAALLNLEDVYPGWDGLAAASAALVDRLLIPRAARSIGVLRRWDWAAGRPGTDLRVAQSGRLVVEGCGALSRRAAALADLRLWVDLTEPERRPRALERDGDAYAPHWERWARQERAFTAAEDPRRSADLVVDGRSFPPSVFGVACRSR